jgi:translation initiation factor 2 beta subunit (eIF-2beta)/eIF-5
MEHNGKLYLTSDENVLFDNHYRYQISTIQTSIILKKGTYITILDNFTQFCMELIIDTQLLIKIIGNILSCKSGINKTQQYYLQGQYTNVQIKQIVYDFIQNYLLCIACDKPEICLKTKNSKIKQKCRACGNNVYLEKEELIHIFKKFI